MVEGGWIAEIDLGRVYGIVLVSSIDQEQHCLPWSN